jgi:uncharacterized lipoprotein
MSTFRPSRAVAVVLLAGAVLGTAGCHWFHRGDSAAYRNSPESRPLEVPPDLNQPDTSNAMALPPTGGSVMRSSVGAQAAGGFIVRGQRDEVFAKVGDALAAIPGVTIATKAQLLGTYDVSYEGNDFLVRMVQNGDNVQVSTVDPRGVAANGPSQQKLLAAIKAALGG